MDIKDFSEKVTDDYRVKLFNFIFKDLKTLNKPVILEFGVREGISTKMFLDLCKKTDGKLYSVDIEDCGHLFNDPNWSFIHCRDDNFKLIAEKVADKLDIIYLDSLHQANHVEKIFYHYYKNLKVNGIFIIDDISWLPYVKNNYRDNFHNEINNQETFERLLQIYSSNEINFDLSFSFIASGLAKIIKLTNNELNKKNILILRKLTFKNFVRKVLNKINRH